MSFTEQEIEAAAKAMRKRYAKLTRWEDTPDLERAVWRNDARAALAAVTESRTVTDVAGLDALPDDSVVLDADGIAYQKDEGIDWSGYGRWWGTGQISLPAQVLHYGEGAGK